MTSYLEAIGMPDRYRRVQVPCALCDGREFTPVQSRGRIAGPGVYGELPIRGCNRCGFLMINPRYEDQFYRDYYLQVYRRVATGEIRPTPEYLQRQAQRGGRILRFLEGLGTRPGKLLDVGCAAGATMIPFRNASWEVTGVDPDLGCIEHGKRALGLSLQLGDAENLAFPAGTFDLVLNLGTFEHAYDLRKAFQNCRRVLKENGLLFLQYRSTTLWGSPLEYFNHNHSCYFSDNTIRLGLRVFGFEPAEFTREPLEGIPGMHYVVARPTEPVSQEQVLQAIEGGLRDDVPDFLARLRAYEHEFRERARRYLALVDRLNGDPEGISCALRAGEADYRILDGPVEEAVQRGILEARSFLQFMEADMRMLTR